MADAARQRNHETELGTLAHRLVLARKYPPSAEDFANNFHDFIVRQEHRIRYEICMELLHEQAATIASARHDSEQIIRRHAMIEQAKLDLANRRIAQQCETEKTDDSEGTTWYPPKADDQS